MSSAALFWFQNSVITCNYVNLRPFTITQSEGTKQKKWRRNVRDEGILRGREKFAKVPLTRHQMPEKIYCML